MLHILFNLMWWWYLGGAVEKRLDSGKLFVIMLTSALLSGFVQAKFSGIWLGGLVVHGICADGLLLAARRARFLTENGVYLEHGLIGFAIVWLAIGWSGAFGLAIANGAHVTGLLIGLAMAFVDTCAVQRR